MGHLCDGRVVVITGAGRGIGRAHAIEFARQGAKVVVNDIGAELDGSGGSTGPAGEVVDEIRAMGGEAVANGADISTWEGGESLVRSALDAFGDLHVVVNNAGVVRDRMFANASEDEWDLTMQVHLKGHFTTARHAAGYWRDRAKAGEAVDARIINTTSGAGLLGSVGQAAYSAAKGGIISLTLVQAAELGRYGITANAICPIARTRMTEGAFGDAMKAPEEGFDVNDPANVSPFVAWLASSESREVSGRVWEVVGGQITAFDGYRREGTVDAGKRWEPSEIGAAVKQVLADSKPLVKVYGT